MNDRKHCVLSEIIVLIAIGVVYLWVSSDDLETAERIAEHRQETLAAARPADLSIYGLHPIARKK